MGIEYSFIDSMVYGPDDINDITKSLVGAGIAPFVSKNSYNVSDLNELTSALVEAGVQLDGCKCSVESAGNLDMIITVEQGIVFFESGVRLSVDEDGYIIPVTPNTAGYIFAHYSPSLQKVDIVFDSELPMDGECVLLAEIMADGTISDKRNFSRSKIATLGRNVPITVHFVNIKPSFIRTDNRFKYYKVAKVSGVDLSKFNYAIMTSGELSSREIKMTCLYDITQDMGIFSIQRQDWVVLGNKFRVRSGYGITDSLEICDNELCIVSSFYEEQNERTYIGYIEQDYSQYVVTLV